MLRGCYSGQSASSNRKKKQAALVVKKPGRKKGTWKFDKHNKESARKRGKKGKCRLPSLLLTSFVRVYVWKGASGWTDGPLTYSVTSCSKVPAAAAWPKRTPCSLTTKLYRWWYQQHKGLSGDRMGKVLLLLEYRALCTYSTWCCVNG
jgi:hypothetical protein